MAGYLDRGSVLAGRIPAPEGLDKYYSRDIFECEIDGLPRYCGVCESWKPDRAHHSSEAGRCLFKFDHYCPWAGGTVAEASFKFFVQFCAYSCIFCAFVLVSTAFFVAERSIRFGTYDVNWIIILALSALFFMFTLGMSINTFHAIVLNSTTIDKLSRRARIHYLAVLIPTTEVNSAEHEAQPNRTITFPLPNSTTHVAQSTRPRQFAIIASPTGKNPYQLASTSENFKSVMGKHFWDWILPLSQSPCCAHTQQSRRFGRIMYPLGPVVDQMLIDAELVSRSDAYVRIGSQGREVPRQIQPPMSMPRDNHEPGKTIVQETEPTQATSSIHDTSRHPATLATYIPHGHQSSTVPEMRVPDPQGSFTMSRLHGDDNVSQV